jgi:hypothetical protein
MLSDGCEPYRASMYDETPDFTRVLADRRTSADEKERGRRGQWCPGAESNHRHCDFQSHALPTELPGRRPDQVQGAPVYSGAGQPCLHRIAMDGACPTWLAGGLLAIPALDRAYPLKLPSSHMIPGGWAADSGLLVGHCAWREPGFRCGLEALLHVLTPGVMGPGWSQSPGGAQRRPLAGTTQTTGSSINPTDATHSAPQSGSSASSSLAGMT